MSEFPYRFNIGPWQNFPASRPTTSGAGSRQELDEELAYQIGRAYAAFLNPARVAVGRDVRTSSRPWPRP